MKAFLLSFVCLISILSSKAQNNPVNALPPGKYETIIRNSQDKWERGDIILMDDNKYMVSTSNEVGDFKFSVTAQRIFFMSGPLKSLYARTSTSNELPVIVLPVPENQQMGLKLPSEIWCYYKH